MNQDDLLPKKQNLYLFNTETRTKSKFEPLTGNSVKMYTCGPTVYDYAHIGNFRTYVFEDILRRTFKFFGYKVMQVMNLTDIDDKTIKGSIQKKLSLSEYTQPYIDAFFEDLTTLNIEKAENYPAATDYIPQMIAFIEKLLSKEVAYQSKDKSIYFSIAKQPRYGRLSHLHIEELKVGAGDVRVASDEYDKENVADFVLWKAYDPERDGKIYWESPFGPGRPGWHLECSTMAMSLLGESLDVHCGAVDNIFPHHENEIAQSEAFSSKPFVKYWIHSEHLIVNHKKMSKSLGNFYTLRDLQAKGYNGSEIRYMLMHIHYRMQLNFTFEGLEGAKNSLSRLNAFIQRMQEYKGTSQSATDICHAILKKSLEEFSNALADDLNMSVALAAIFEMMHEINLLYDKNLLSAQDAKEVIFLMEQFNRILGVFTFEHEATIPLELIQLLEERQKARASKDWALADLLRDKIHQAGYTIEDTASGPRLKLM